jgi:hypothetical protein
VEQCSYGSYVPDRSASRGENGMDRIIKKGRKIPSAPLGS